MNYKDDLRNEGRLTNILGASHWVNSTSDEDPSYLYLYDDATQLALVYSMYEYTSGMLK